MVLDNLPWIRTWLDTIFQKSFGWVAKRASCSWLLSCIAMKSSSAVESLEPATWYMPATATSIAVIICTQCFEASGKHYQPLKLQAFAVLCLLVEIACSLCSNNLKLRLCNFSFLLVDNLQPWLIRKYSCSTLFFESYGGIIILQRLPFLKYIFDFLNYIFVCSIYNASEVNSGSRKLNGARIGGICEL